MLEDDKVLNMQITVMKLQEELAFHRNGTSSDQIYDLLVEKDAEISSLKAGALENSEKLRKLARKSTEVLQKCKFIEEERDAAIERKNELKKLRSQSELKRLDTEKELVCVRAELCAVKERCSDLEKHNEALKREQGFCNDDVEKLQSRCAGLIIERMETSKALERENIERAESTKSVREDLEMSMRLIADLNQQINKMKAENLEIASTLQDDKRVSLDSKRAALQFAQLKEEVCS